MSCKQLVVNLRKENRVYEAVEYYTAVCRRVQYLITRDKHNLRTERVFNALSTKQFSFPHSILEP